MYSISYVWISVLCADVSPPRISRGAFRIPTRVHPGGNAERTLANVPDWKRLGRILTIQHDWNNFGTIGNGLKRLSYRSKSIVFNRVLSIFSRRVIKERKLDWIIIEIWVFRTHELKIVMDFMVYYCVVRIAYPIHRILCPRASTPW